MPKLLHTLPLLFLIACTTAPSDEVFQTAIAQTALAQRGEATLPPPTDIPKGTLPLPTVDLGATMSVNQTQNAVRDQTANAFATWAALTPSATATQTFTPAPTNTPDLTQTAEAEILANDVALTETAAVSEATQAELTASRGSGFYLVGVDIAPGIWRSTAGSDSCYWARYDENQNILDNDFGQSGGAVTIRTTDFQVEFDDCGTWEYISP